MQRNSTTVDGHEPSLSLKNRRSFLQGGSDEGLPGPQAGKLPGSFARQGKLSPAVCQIQLPENVRTHVWMRCNALHFPRLESPYLNLHRICVFVLCSTYTALCKILFFPPSQEQHISVFFSDALLLQQISVQCLSFGTQFFFHFYKWKRCVCIQHILRSVYYMTDAK